LESVTKKRERIVNLHGYFKLPRFPTKEIK
jgi:hypothetical protein